MTIGEKIKLLADTLDVDENKLSSETVLTSLNEWDSMGKISLMAIFKKSYSKELSVEQISAFRLIQDVLDLME